MNSATVAAVHEYYGLARYRAKKVYNALFRDGSGGVELDDLMQAGLLGLVEAWNRYDPAKGTTFSTFCLPRVDGAIRDFLRGLDPLPQRKRQKLKELDKKKRELINDLGREPSEIELARELSIPVEEVRKVEALRVTILSFEQMSYNSQEEEQRRPRKISSNNPGPDEVVLRDRDRPKLIDSVDRCLEEVLDDNEREILKLRVLGGTTLKVVAKLHGLSIETARRREKTSREKMKKCLEKHGWHVEDVVLLFPT